MNSLILLLGTTVLLGSALVGGVFFAFYSFVIKALARVTTSVAIATMQSINVVVINPSFMTAFMGTALLSVAMVILMLVSINHPSTMFFIGGAIFYFVGTFLVTLFGNVPLNNQLAAVSAMDPDATMFWTHYIKQWTIWNHIRTAAAMAAALLYTIGLIQNGGI